MADKTVEQTPTDLAIDPNSEPVELSQGCDNVALDIAVRAGDEQENGQSDVLSEESETELEKKKQRRRGKQKAKRHKYMLSEPKAPKLRPAACRKAVREHTARRLLTREIDILNRIQWDPAFKSEDFVIGYIERFEGIKEISFGLWLRESTEEDFVPQHRIRYFKKDQSEEVVWSRDDRIDKVFGSGVGAGR